MERGAAMDIISGILRRRLTLDAVIRAVSRRPPEQLDPAVRSILWVGAYQLLFSDHVADYAAVDSSVRLAAKLNISRAGGFINAVLRSIQRLDPTVVVDAKPTARSFPAGGQRWMNFNRNIFPSPTGQKNSYWAQATSIPEELVADIFHAFGERAARIFINADMRPPVICRVNRPEILQRSERLRPHARSGWAVVEGGINGEILAAIERGDLSPQDPTAGLPANWIINALKTGGETAQRPREILDLCAGRGTKTVQLALGGLRVAATDISTEKLELLSRREQFLQTGRIRILPALPMPGPRFDAVLVDVPCSNTGVMARRPEVRWRIKRLNFSDLLHTQMTLLNRGADLAGNILVYSTCSIFPGENQDMIRQFLAGECGKPWELIKEEATLPVADAESWHDGGYAAMLKRREPIHTFTDREINK